jgi:hypothetical protein
MPDTQPEEIVPMDIRADRKRSKNMAIEKAKAKNARLRLMKERNENYLAEREVDEDLELRVPTGD